MKHTLITKFFIFGLLFGFFSLTAGSVQAVVDEFKLIQTQKALLADQRLVGNVSAQAKREGVVVDVPQLFIYYGDTSPAYHLAGFRPTLVRELEIIINARRMERSMVGLSRLLDRAETTDGSTASVSDLPDADLYVVLYERGACEPCAQVRETIEGWLADRSDDAFWITISLDR